MLCAGWVTGQNKIFQLVIVTWAGWITIVFFEFRETSTPCFICYFVERSSANLRTIQSTQLCFPFELLGTSRLFWISTANLKKGKYIWASHEKRVFMQSLTKLKDIKKYAKISMTEDFTRAERELIKHWKITRKSKESTREESLLCLASLRDCRGFYLRKIFTKTCV